MTLHVRVFFFFFFNDTATTEIYTLSLHDALPICVEGKKKYWPMKNTRAIRTAANTARFSMLTSLVASSGADPSRPDERGDTAPAATPRAPDRAPVRARPEPGVRIPSTWARTDTRRGAGEPPGAGRRPPRRPRAGPAPSRESRAGNRDRKSVV